MIGKVKILPFYCYENNEKWRVVTNNIVTSIFFTLTFVTGNVIT